MDAFYVKKAFDDYALKVTSGDKLEQRQFLLSHPKRNIAEQNVLREIKVASLRMGRKFDRKRLDQLILAGAQIFFQCAINAKIRDLITSAELKRHEQKAGELADTQAMVDDWGKEAMRTSITKAVPGLRDAKEASERDVDQLGGDRGHGPTVQPPGRDPAVPRAD